MFGWLQKYIQLNGADGPQDSLWRTIQAITLGSVLLLLGIGWLMFSLTSVLSDRRETATLLTSIHSNLNSYERLLADMEAAQRGWFLTRNRAYLEPYKAARENLPALSGQIEADVLSFPLLKAQFAVVRSQTKGKFAELELSLETDTFKGPEAALELVRSNLGKQLMDQLRHSIKVLRHSIETQLHENHEGIELLSFQRAATMALLLALALVGGVLSLWLMRRYAQSEYHGRIERQRADAASAASREKSSFLANMSHEIRTPMNAIFGFAQLLGDMVKDPREQFYARAITQSGQVLLALINDILDMSKIEAGKMDLAPEPVNLREMLRSCETLFLHMVTEKGLALKFELADDLPPAVTMDPLRLRQVLINLIGNALKYTPEGSITVTATASPLGQRKGCTYLSFKVRDTGPGIPEEKRARMFEPFVQLGQSTGAGGGAGLGLSIVKRLVGLMGGDISLESGEGTGSCFIVTLPNTPLAEALASRERTRQPLSQLRPLKILAVDDVDLNRRLIEGIFTNTHHQVLVASDGAAGVAMAERERPDLIFMDIRMPVMDGVSALRMIRRNPQLNACKVVAATASSLLGEESSMRHLFDGYLRKPLTREHIEDELYRLFEKTEAGEPALLQEAPARQQAMPESDRAAYSALAPALRAALGTATATLSSDDVRHFVEMLQQLPATPAFAAAGQQAQAIATAAAVFDIAELEQRLAQAQALLNSLHEAAP